MKTLPSTFRCLCLLLLMPLQTWASTQSDVDFILQAKNPPVGVVFEVVEGDEHALDWAIPAIRSHINALRKKFPQMKMAVVTHGREQFGLLKENQQKLGEVHASVKSLVSDDVPLHVCGTHASWYDKDKHDFPEYVDVAPAGPAKIRAYQRQGYALIVIER